MRIAFATLLTVAAIGGLAATGTLASDPAGDARKAAAKAEVGKLLAMAGRWKGSGWMMLPGGKSTFNSEETVEARLDGAALLIEGFHRSTDTNVVVHHALAILAWDTFRNEYRFQSALVDGRTGSFPGKLEDARFVWAIEPPNAPWSRFTISVDADRWIEDGEMSRDGGKTWMKFFEMRLTRVK
jgi:hypothetical protein